MKKIIFIFWIALYFVSKNKIFANDNGGQLTLYVNKTVHFDLKIDGAGPTDTVTFIVWKKMLAKESSSVIERDEKKVGLGKDSSFHITISDITQISYLSINTGVDFNGTLLNIMDQYLIEPGDSIKVNIINKGINTLGRPIWNNLATSNNEYKKRVYDAYNISFFGRGVSKYNCQLELDKLQNSVSTRNFIPSISNLGIYYRPNNKNDSVILLSNNVLSKYENSLDQCMFELIKQNMFYSFSTLKLVEFYNVIANTNYLADSIYKTIQSIYNAQYRPLISISLDKCRFASELSNTFPNFLLRYYTLLYIMDHKLSPKLFGENKLAFYSFLSSVNHNQQLIMDKVKTLFILENYYYIDEPDSLANEALKSIKSPYCLSELNKLQKSLSKGKEAYNFQLQSRDNKSVKLSDFNGKVVFMDFWFTGCGACRSFYEYQLSKVEDYFKDNPNVVFVTVSVDKNKDVWLNSLKSRKYTSDVAVNLYTGGEGVQHPIINFYRLKGFPQPILIDKAGKIAEINAFKLRNADTAIKVISSVLVGESKYFVKDK